MYSKDCTISVETSDSHENYYTAYKYICKSDKSLLQSDEHPDLREIGSPKIKHCMKAYQRKHELKKNNHITGKTKAK